MSAAPAARHARLGQPARCGIGASPVTRGRTSAPGTGCSPAARASREISAARRAPSSRSVARSAPPSARRSTSRARAGSPRALVEGRPAQREIGVVECSRRRRGARSTVARDRARGAARAKRARQRLAERAGVGVGGQDAERGVPLPGRRPAARRAPRPGPALARAPRLAGAARGGRRARPCRPRARRRGRRDRRRCGPARSPNRAPSAAGSSRRLASRTASRRSGDSRSSAASTPAASACSSTSRIRLAVARRRLSTRAIARKLDGSACTSASKRSRSRRNTWLGASARTVAERGSPGQERHLAEEVSGAEPVDPPGGAAVRIVHVDAQPSGGEHEEAVAGLALAADRVALLEDEGIEVGGELGERDPVDLREERDPGEGVLQVWAGPGAPGTSAVIVPSRDQATRSGR